MSEVDVFIDWFRVIVIIKLHNVSALDGLNAADMIEKSVRDQQQ